MAAARDVVYCTVHGCGAPVRGGRAFRPASRTLGRLGGVIFLRNAPLVRACFQRLPLPPVWLSSLAVGPFVRDGVWVNVHGVVCCVHDDELQPSRQWRACWQLLANDVDTGAFALLSARRLPSLPPPALRGQRDGVRVPGKQLHPLSIDERRAIVLSARDLLSETLSPKPDGPGAFETVPVKEVFDAELDLWHMSAEGNVHHTGGITSRVSGVEGRVVITAAHGSRYRLKRIKPEVLRVLERIGASYDDAHPLDNVSSVVYAGAVAQVEPLMAQARSVLSQIEVALTPFGTSVEECFATMNQAMQALGFPPTPHDV